MLYKEWHQKYKNNKIVDFYGHILTGNGIQPLKDKLEAIHNMKSPSNMGELQTILDMENYLNYFLTKPADL